jgi:hypothetical protein
MFATHIEVVAAIGQDVCHPFSLPDVPNDPFGR